MVVASLMAFGVAQASADLPTFDTSFDGSTITPAPTNPFAPAESAVDPATGDVWVIDNANAVIDRFEADGAYVEQVDGSETEAGEFGFGGIDQIATDSAGNLYVVTESPSKVFAFEAANGYELLWEGTGLSEMCGVAVDSLGNPWTQAYGNGMQKRNPVTGAAEGDSVVAETNCNAYFDSANNLYLNKYNGGVSKYAAPDYTGSGAEIETNATSGLAIDTTSDALYTVRNSGELAMFKASGSEEAGSPLATGAFTGISVNPDDGKLYASVGSEGEVQVFDIPALPEFALTATVSGAGSGSLSASSGTISGCTSAGGATCAGEYTEGKTVILTAAPQPGSKVGNWTGCDSNPTPVTCSLVMPAAPAAVGVSFEPALNYILTVDVTGAGEVKCQVGADPVGPCAAQYQEGTVVTLSATPAAHNKFSGWGAADAGACALIVEPCAVTMSADKTLTAPFVPITRTVKAVVQGGGKVAAASGVIVNCTSSGGAACEGPYGEDSEVVLTAAPNAHQKFLSWSGCTTVVGAQCKLKVPAANATVTAQFAPIVHTLTVSRAGSGSGSVSCDGAACAASYEEGAKITIAASAASGSSFAGFSGGGCSATPCTLTLEADTTVAATFNTNPPPAKENPPAPPPPPAPAPAATCTVPKLVGKSLSKAKSALKAAHCTLGKVTKPKSKNGKKKALVVKSSTPAAGKATTAKVGLKLGPKPKKGKK